MKRNDHDTSTVISDPPCSPLSFSLSLSLSFMRDTIPRGCGKKSHVFSYHACASLAGNRALMNVNKYLRSTCVRDIDLTSAFSWRVLHRSDSSFKLTIDYQSRHVSRREFESERQREELWTLYFLCTSVALSWISELGPVTCWAMICSFSCAGVCNLSYLQLFLMTLWPVIIAIIASFLSLSLFLFSFRSDQIAPKCITLNAFPWLKYCSTIR